MAFEYVVKTDYSELERWNRDQRDTSWMDDGDGDALENKCEKEGMVCGASISGSCGRLADDLTLVYE